MRLSLTCSFRGGTLQAEVQPAAPVGTVGDLQAGPSGQHNSPSGTAGAAERLQVAAGWNMPAPTLASPLPLPHDFRGLAAPPGASWPASDPGWQYRDLWLASEAQANGRTIPISDLSARLNSLALHGPGSLPPMSQDLAAGFPPTAMFRGVPYPAAHGRRSSLENNHNKAITKKLASAVHYQQVWCSALYLHACSCGRN